MDLRPNFNQNSYNDPQQNQQQQNNQQVDPRFKQINIPVNPIYSQNQPKQQHQQQLQPQQQNQIQQKNDLQQPQLQNQQSNQSSKSAIKLQSVQIQENNQKKQNQDSDENFNNNHDVENNNSNRNNKDQVNDNKKDGKKPKGLGDRLKNFANDGLNYIKSGYEKAQQQYDAAKETEAYQKMQEIKQQGLVKIGQVKQNLEQEFDNLDNKKKEFLTNQKESMNKWVRSKMEYIILQLLERGRPEVQDMIKDPDMCVCVQNLVDDIIDEIWPDIEETVLHHLKMKFNEPQLWEEKKPDFICPLNWPWYTLRRWYLYSMQPYNRSIWQQMRTFSFWFIILIQCISVYNIQPFIYILIFLMIDKYDEWQLIRYIIDYKRMQFIAYGLIQGVVGYISFFMCNTFNDHYTMEERKSCITSGPGSELNILLDSIGFCLQVFLIWVSFICLPCTEKSRGKMKFKYDKQKSSIIKTHTRVQCCCCSLDNSNGGRLKGFLFYDLICFLLCIGTIFFIYMGLGYDKEYQIRQTIFMMKIAYGILSSVFLLFSLPAFTEVLTKSKATGYDKYGNLAPKQIIYTKEDWKKSDEKDAQRIQRRKQQKLNRLQSSRIGNGLAVNDNNQLQQQQQQQGDFEMQRQQQYNQNNRDEEKDGLLEVDFGEIMH